ncbi:MAG: 2-isopropylmalate synthase [Methanocellales archaeon]
MKVVVFYSTSLIKRLPVEQVQIFDTTLRDGEQTPGVSFTVEEKFAIAKQLDKLGVDIIEAGFPITSKGEKTSVKKIASAGLNAKICALARVTKDDIKAALDCDVDMVHIFVSTSDIQIKHTIKKTKEEIIQLAVEGTEMVKSHGRECLFSAMDATRTDLDFLLQINREVEKAGVDCINIPDTVGVMVPSATYELISRVRNAIKVPIHIHCHNDFGLAVANSIAALEAGANCVQVTVNRLGERAGNADLAETVMTIHSIYGAKTNIKTQYLVETSKLVERLTGIKMPPNTPVVGDNAFSHESGIHTHGVIQKAETFEPGVMTPEMVGHKRRIVHGKHAGKHGVKKTLNEAGIYPNEEQLAEILERIKDLGDKGKRVTEADLFAIAEGVMGKVAKEKRAFVLKEITVMTGNKITPTASVRAVFNGEEKLSARTGVGPVDAALNAVQSILGEKAKIKLRDFSLEAITGGSDALAEVVISVEDEKGSIVSARAAREDIVMASVEALISAINRLMLLKK